jgi:hypothetical protein
VSPCDSEEESDISAKPFKPAKKRKAHTNNTPTSSGSTHNKRSQDNLAAFDAGWSTDSFEHGMDIWPMGAQHSYPKEIELNRLSSHTSQSVFAGLDSVEILGRDPPQSPTRRQKTGHKTEARLEWTVGPDTSMLSYDESSRQDSPLGTSVCFGAEDRFSPSVFWPSPEPSQQDDRSHVRSAGRSISPSVFLGEIREGETEVRRVLSGPCEGLPEPVAV